MRRALTGQVKGSTLKDWALAVARRSGPKRAKVALEHKLAVMMHRMLGDGTNFEAGPAAAAAAA